LYISLVYFSFFPALGSHLIRVFASDRRDFRKPAAGIQLQVIQSGEPFRRIVAQVICIL